MFQLPNICNGYKKVESSKHENTSGQQTKTYDYFSTRIPRTHIENILKSIKDERFLFFIKYGTLRRYEGECEIIYVEIPQIPKKLVIYRRPYCRMKSMEKLNLSRKDLPHIPLFEGEDHLKYLSLEMNQITKIDQLISLNNLIYLNLYGNHIKEIENLSHTNKLRVLLLGKNNIEKIKNLQSLVELEILDLHSNKIKIPENLGSLKKLRVLNLANNQITSIFELSLNKNLEELNIRKNLIAVIPNMSNNFEILKKINIGKNLISKVEFLLEFSKLKFLQEIILENNPVLNNPEAIDYLHNLPIKGKVPILLSKTAITSNKSVALTRTLKNTNENNLSVASGLGQSPGISPNQNVYKSSGNLVQGSGKSIEGSKIQNQTGTQGNLFLPNKVKKLTSYSERGNKDKQIINENIEQPNNSNLTPTANQIKTITKEKSVIIAEDFINKTSASKILPIQKLWYMEYANIVLKGYNGYNHKKYREINIDQGHVEMEKENELFLFGNCLKVLTHSEFYKKINTLSFYYFCYDFIMSKRMLSYLKQFTNLKSIYFANNNIFSFYQLTKLENFENLENLRITENEICFCGLLKFFVLYRINTLRYFNGKEVKEEEKLNARKIFHVFDKTISLKEKETMEKIEKQKLKQLLNKSKEKKENKNINNTNNNDKSNDKDKTERENTISANDNKEKDKDKDNNNNNNNNNINNLIIVNNNDENLTTNINNAKFVGDIVNQYNFFDFAKNNLSSALHEIFEEENKREEEEEIE